MTSLTFSAATSASASSNSSSASSYKSAISAFQSTQETFKKDMEELFPESTSQIPTDNIPHVLQWLKTYVDLFHSQALSCKNTSVKLSKTERAFVTQTCLAIAKLFHETVSNAENRLLKESISPSVQSNIKLIVGKATTITSFFHSTKEDTVSLNDETEELIMLLST